MTDRAALQTAFARLNELLNAGAGGWDDRTTAAEVRQLLTTLEYGLADPYAQGKIRSAQRWADILFSARKHQQWGSDGAAKVRHFLRSDISVADRNSD